MRYQLVLRQRGVAKPKQVWRGQHGHDMTASQATELLLHIAAAAPELHDGPDYLAVVRVTDDAVVRRRMPRHTNWRVAERHVGTGQLLRAIDVDGRGRRLTRHRAKRLVGAEYDSRGDMFVHPGSWTYLAVERIGASA